jgi:hypothetical protein
MEPKMKLSIFIERCKDKPSDDGCIFYDLETEGHTLFELLQNAVYWQVDQDGQNLGDIPADDAFAESLIAKEWLKNEAEFSAKLARLCKN